MANQSDLNWAAQKGDQDGAASAEQGSTWGGCLESVLFLSHYDPPADPELKEVYDQHFNGK